MLIAANFKGENAASKWTTTVFSKGIHTFFRKIPATIRGHCVAVLGEFIGTLFFLFFGFAGVQVAKIASNNNAGANINTQTAQTSVEQLLYIALCFGFSLAVNAWVFFRISGGLFNPAVTLAIFLIGGLSFVRFILLSVAQIVGGIAAAGIVDALFSGGLNVSTTLHETTTIAQGVIIEMLLTSQLVFTILMLATEKHAGSFIAPVGIGLSLFIAELIGVFWTGGSLNPARSLAPEILSGFEHYDWVYWVGPLAGSVLAVLFFKLIKALEYENVGKAAETDLESARMPTPKETPRDTRRSDSTSPLRA